jgi:hypothetical protein
MPEEFCTSYRWGSGSEPNVETVEKPFVSF